MSRVVVKDRGASALLERLRALSGVKVRVGVLADAPKRESGDKAGELSLLEVAALHEFGAPAAGIPQRSFIRATVDERASDIASLQEMVVGSVVKGRIEPEQAGNLLGMKVAAMVQQRIASNIPPPLKPETVRRKKSSVSLINTGQLRSSITWIVEGS